MVAIVLLLKLAFGFVVRTTHLFRKLQQTNDPTVRKKLKPLSEA